MGLSMVGVVSAYYGRLLYLYLLERRGAESGHIERMGRITQFPVPRGRR
jgi:hypothetical protein